jgi:MraZ protein
VLLTGNELYKVDDKRRINLPSWAVNEYLFELNAPDRQPPKVIDLSLILTYGPNACLFVYSRETFQKKAEKISQHYGSRAITEDEKRRFFLETFRSPLVRCDQQGRITVPKELLDYAGIAGQVQILGAYDHLELWNPDRFEAFMSAGQSPQERLNQYAAVENE